MDITLVESGIASIKAAGEIARSLLKMAISNDVKEKVMEIQQSLFDAHSSNLQLQADYSTLLQRVRDLEEEIMRSKTWAAERERYRLTSPWHTGVVYGVKQSAVKPGDPPHYLCTNCYENGRKSILNPKSDINDYTLYACPACGSAVPTGFCGPVSAAFAPE